MACAISYPASPALAGWLARHLQVSRTAPYIAGVLSNVPSNMVDWIMNPQAFVPGNAMPIMGVSEEDARDMAAYLYTLRQP